MVSADSALAWAHIMNLVCQGAGGSGGQDWEGPHLLVGRLLLGHTVRQEEGGWGRQVIIRTMLVSMSAGLLGQTPPKISDHVGEVFVGLAGHIPFQAAHDFGGVEPFVSPSCHVTTRLGVG